MRIKRIMKYWTPMFYAGGSYNYSNELMELLHNTLHDWPRKAVQTIFNGMLVNSTGKPDGFTETDIRVERLNDAIKENTHGTNATPAYLEKITPAIGHVQHLTEHMYQDLGVEDLNQYHASVRQHKDVEILVEHLVKNRIFEWSEDKASDHLLIDLYRNGLERVASGGHARHLKRHALRSRTRHNTASDTFQSLHVDSLDLERELNEARDVEMTPHTLREDDRLLEDVANNGTLDTDENELEREFTEEDEYGTEGDITMVVDEFRFDAESYEWDGMGDEDEG
jgi:hypothetical protein